MSKTFLIGLFNVATNHLGPYVDAKNHSIFSLMGRFTFTFIELGPNLTLIRVFKS